MKRAFRSIVAIYKLLFHRYLESLNTSWKILHKLVRVVKKSLHETFVTNGKAILNRMKEQLNKVVAWYGNFRMPITSFSYGEL